MVIQIFFTILVNIIVGLLIGWSGIAGFLLPMFYVGYMKLPVASALTLSFASFAVSGIIGATNYHKKGNLPIKTAIPLGIGSLIGAIPGVALNSMIPADIVKFLLYVVVLASGISILIREKRTKNISSSKTSLIQSPLIVAFLGFITAIICALSGAGGPILVMPLLVVLGMDVRLAIGTALFGSIFIALPSIVGYGLQSNISTLWSILLMSCVAHGIGVLIGSKTSHFIKQKPLKITVAIFSIAIALYMMISMLIKI